MKMLSVLTVLVVCTTFSWGQAGVPASQPATVVAANSRPAKLPIVRKPKLAAVIRGDLRSGDQDTISIALSQLQDPKVVTPVLVLNSIEYYWSADLIKQHQYDLITQLCDRGMTGDLSTPGSLASLTKVRYEALLAQSKFDDALSMAKTYYNLCQLQDTREAIRMISEAMLNSRGRTDPDIVSRFQQQQTALAQAPASVDGPLVALPPELGANILTSIKVDETLYDAAIKAVAAGPITYKTLTAQGNLLLAADRAKDAEKAFQTASDLATDKQLADAITNMARAIRAEDGSVGRANAYILSLRATAPAKPDAARAK